MTTASLWVRSLLMSSGRKSWLRLCMNCILASWRHSRPSASRLLSWSCITLIWLSSLVFLPCACHHDWHETHCWSQDWCHPGSWVIILTIIITTDHSCSVISSLKVWRWCSSWTLSPMCFISSRSICTVTTCRSRRTGNLANITSPVSTLVVSLIPLHFK